MPNLDPDGVIGKAIVFIERVLYICVGTILAVMGATVVVQSVRDMTRFNLTATTTGNLAFVLNDVLFAIIILELLSTVFTHLFKGGLQLKSFLIIGIISSVRRILVLGAQLSAGSLQGEALFRRGVTELAIDALVVLALSIALFITRLIPPPKRRSPSQARRPATEVAS